MAFFLIHIQIKVVYFQDDIRICRIAHSSISISNNNINILNFMQLVPLEHYPNAYSDLKTLIAKPKAQSMNL